MRNLYVRVRKLVIRGSMTNVNLLWLTEKLGMSGEGFASALKNSLISENV